MDNDRLYTLDAMRGGAAIFVVAFHMAAPIVPGGYLAVDFFFGLSGLVIAQAYQRRLHAGLTSWRFMKLRIARLYPMFALGSAFGLGQVLMEIAVQDRNALPPDAVLGTSILGFLMLPSPFSPRELFPLDGPAWSLFLEMMINLIFAVALVNLRSRALLLLAAISAAALLVAAIQFGNLSVGWRWQNAWGGPPRVMFSFLIGMLLTRLTIRPLLNGWWFAAPMAFLAIALALPIPKEWRSLYDVASVVGLLPVLLFGGAAFSPPKWFTPISKILGEISYPLYAIHLPLLHLTQYAMHDISAYLWMPVFFTMIVTLAYLLARFIDPHLRLWMGKFMGTHLTSKML